MDVFALQGYGSLAVVIVLLLVKVFAFANAILFSSEAYQAAGKWTKPAWVIVLGIAVAAQVILLSGGGFLINLAFLIAALVYLADVRPALNSVTRR